MTGATVSKAGAAPGTMILPLALAQFIASYAATAVNVAISAIATDLHTNVEGAQTAITLFTLTMAALMIPGSKLTNIRGRKRGRPGGYFRRSLTAREAPCCMPVWT